MGQRTVSTKSSLALSALVALILCSGCAMPVDPAAQAPQGAPTGATLGAPAAPGTTPGVAGVPPSLTGDGASPNGTPGVVLPAPAALTDRIAQLQQKYGFKSLKGENTTADKLDALDANYAKYPAGSFKDLDIVFAQAGGQGGPSQDGSGVWFKVDANGQDASPPQGPTQGGAPLAAPTPAGARITYFGNKLNGWLFVHEVGHHVTLWAKAAFGQALINGLGWTPSGQLPADPIAAADSDYTATNVAATSYPTEYSKSGAAQEHIAEVITVHLLGRNTPDQTQDPIQAGFTVPAAVNTSLKAELPNAPGI